MTQTETEPKDTKDQLHDLTKEALACARQIARNNAKVAEIAEDTRKQQTRVAQINGEIAKLLSGAAGAEVAAPSLPTQTD